MSDLISRQAAIDCEYQVKIINDIEYVMLSEVQMKMRNLPSAQPERKKGKWIADRYCSVCEWDKHEFDFFGGWRENFCPCCGADMRGEQEE